MNVSRCREVITLIYEKLLEEKNELTIKKIQKIAKGFVQDKPPYKIFFIISSQFINPSKIIWQSRNFCVHNSFLSKSLLRIKGEEI